MSDRTTPVRLFMFSPLWGIPSSSPFCIKLDAWLRMSGIPYEVVGIGAPHAAPKKKAPWIEDGDVRMGDSALIIDHLSARYGIDLDAHLSGEQRALAVVLRGMLEERYYQVIMYTHFVRDEGWAVNKEILFEAPAPLRPIIGRVMRRAVRKDLWWRGFGRHAHEEIVAFGQKDLRALSTLLGEKPFFFGDEPSSFDACAYGFLAMTLRCPVPSAVKDDAARLPNLTAFLDRFEERYYREALALPFQAAA